MTANRKRVRLVFADAGTFHNEDMEVPLSVVEGYDRLIDGLQEDPEFLKAVYLDLGRLCAAWVLPDDV